MDTKELLNSSELPQKKPFHHRDEKASFYSFQKNNQLFFLVVCITAHELVHTSCSIHQLRLTSVERVR